MTAGSGRYAVYFAPDADSPLARFGAEWLGYDVATGAATAQPAVAGITPDRLQAITAEPRRYGFHATLKPPFVLADGAEAGALDEAAAALARRSGGFAAPRLRLSCISGFWALTLSAPCPEMVQLADSCVRDLDRYRAAPAEAELARRRRAGLSRHQEALLVRWGYPYVMDEFRFHMTLTQRLDATEGAVIERILKPLVDPFCQALLAVNAISLFHQPDTDVPFRLIRRYPLAG